jgi:glucosamine-6-phosphate deaminase
LTMGVATILEAREIILVVTGAAKAEALCKVVNGPADEAVPGSVLSRHPCARIIADEAAAQKLIVPEGKVLEFRRTRPTGPG